MARLKTVGQPDESSAVRLYRDWSTARATSKEAAGELGEILKGAVEDLGMVKKAIKLAFELKRQDPVKCSAFLRDFDQLREDLGLAVQTELEDAIRDTQPAA